MIPAIDPGPGDGTQISVVVPAYACAERLAAHACMLDKIRPLCREIFWVTTPSPDGTHDLVAQIARQAGDEVARVAPGLYAAWNFGIQRVQGPFVYISTVGEDISAQGLQEMLQLLEQTGAHLCFSPPEIIPATPMTIRRTRHWPVFRHRRLLQKFDQRVLPMPLLARLQVLSGISCVLGSCASALFRSDFLGQNPFPLDFLHYGDTAWFYRNLCRLRVAYLHQVRTTFHVHDLSDRPVLLADLHRLVEELSRGYRELHPGSLLPDQMLTLQGARERLDCLREPHPYRFWWMSPVAWFWRLRRDLLNLQIWSGRGA